MKTEKLRVTSIQIRDVLGARDFSMEVGRVTTLSGKNGSGKTTAIEAIKSAIGGGNLANLAYIPQPGDPADEEINPEVVLVLEGDSEKYLVEKNAKGTKVRKQVGDSAGFEDIKPPGRFLDGLFDKKLSNPIEFLNADKNDRVLLLLGALDVTLDRDALWEAMGIEKRDVGAVPEGLHPLQELALIREAVFRERTGVNRDATQKVATAEQTRRATPAVLPDGHEKEIEALDTGIANRSVEIVQGIEQARSHCEGLAATVATAADADTNAQRDHHNADAAKRWADFEAEIAKRRADLTAEIDAEALEVEKTINGKNEIVNKEIRNLETDRDERLEKLRDDEKTIEADKIRLAELREQAKAAIKARTLHDQAEAFDAEAEKLQAMSKRLTGAIDAVDEYRRKLADNLPIPGLEVDDKAIKVNGVPFDQLNNAQRIDIAVEISCIRSKDQRLPIMWIDGAEALDSESFAALKTSLKKAGVQPIIGRVDSSDLSVTVE